MVNQEWFEMAELRRKRLNNSVWIPLRSSVSRSEGQFGYTDYIKEGTLNYCIAIPNEARKMAEENGIRDTMLQDAHSGYIDEDVYIPSDIYYNHKGQFQGLYLVLEQSFNREENNEWHLHQDIILTLGLKREGDVWICPNEDYIEVVRLYRKVNGKPEIIEIRAEFLKDYLCARDLGLFVKTIHTREIIDENHSFINWNNGSNKYEDEINEWKGYIREIHEGGTPFNIKTAVIHISRKDNDESDDIPDISPMPTDSNCEMKSWTKNSVGRKLFLIIGELKRKEWVEPAILSVRIKGDKSPSEVYFTIDEKGTKEKGESLIDDGRWLWFKPEVIMTLIERRGGALNWFSKDTGSIRCSPDYETTFGVSEDGFINILANDIGILPEWQQKIWAGYNITPEGGGISRELFTIQIRGEYVMTQAPEDEIKQNIELLKKYALENLKIEIFKEHIFIPEIMNKIYRFRAINETGLFSLAKDITRLIADNLNIKDMQKIIKPPKDMSWGSLKTLENILTLQVDKEDAHQIMGPLFGIYDLRTADAHLPSCEIEKSFSMLRIDRNSSNINQGFQMLESCAKSLNSIVNVIKEWDSLKYE